MSARKSLRQVQAKRPKMRETFNTDIAQAKEWIEMELEENALSKHVTKVVNLNKRIQKNLNKYIVYTEEIALHVDSEQRSDLEMEEVRHQEDEDDNCVQAVEDCLNELDTWLNDKVPKQPAAVADVNVPQRQHSEVNQDKLIVNSIAECDKSLNRAIDDLKWMTNKHMRPSRNFLPR